MTTKKTIASLETMKTLIKQSNELVQQQKKDLAVEKEELIKKAFDKVNNYLESVLESMPFKSINVKLKEDYDLLLRKNDSFTIFEKNGERIVRFFVFSKTGWGYTTSSDEYANGTIHSRSHVSKISERELLMWVNNFDSFKDKIESQILRESQKYMDSRMKEMQAEQDALESLKEFVC